MDRLIIALLMLTFTLTANANTMSGAMMGSAYPNIFNNSLTVDLGGGFASTGCTVDAATGDLSCSGDFTFGGQDLKTPLTVGADDIRLLPGGVLALTIFEGGNATLVGDLTVTGGDIGAKTMSSAVTGGADDMVFSPAGVAGFTIAEAGSVLINRVVTSHGACAAAGDRGRMEMYDDGADHVSLCVCEQTAAATYGWLATTATGVC